MFVCMKITLANFLPSGTNWIWSEHQSAFLGSEKQHFLRYKLLCFFKWRLMLVFYIEKKVKKKQVLRKKIPFHIVGPKYFLVLWKCRSFRWLFFLICGPVLANDICRFNEHFQNMCQFRLIVYLFCSLCFFFWQAQLLEGVYRKHHFYVVHVDYRADSVRDVSGDFCIFFPLRRFGLLAERNDSKSCRSRE